MSWTENGNTFVRGAHASFGILYKLPTKWTFRTHLPYRALVTATGSSCNFSARSARIRPTLWMASAFPTDEPPNLCRVMWRGVLFMEKTVLRMRSGRNEEELNFLNMAAMATSQNRKPRSGVGVC